MLPAAFRLTQDVMALQCNNCCGGRMDHDAGADGCSIIVKAEEKCTDCRGNNTKNAIATANDDNRRRQRQRQRQTLRMWRRELCLKPH